MSKDYHFVDRVLRLARILWREGRSAVRRRFRKWGWIKTGQRTKSLGGRDGVPITFEWYEDQSLLSRTTRAADARANAIAARAMTSIPNATFEGKVSAFANKLRRDRGMAMLPDGGYDA